MIIKIILGIILIVGIFCLIYFIILKKKFDKDEIAYQFNELKKSRVLLSVFSIIIALLLSFGIAPTLINIANQKTKVLELTQNVKIGTKLENNMFREIELNQYNLSNNIVKSREDIKNKYAIRELWKGQYLYKDNISDLIPYENEYLYNNLTGMNRAISFTIKNLANGLANKLQQGDVISIIVINSNAKTTEGQTYIPAELQYVEVLTTTNSKGTDIEDTDKKEDDIIYTTITVLVCDEQAKIIANAETTKELFIELVYRPGNKNVAKYLLKKQEATLDTLYENRIDKEDESNIHKILKSSGEEETTEEETNENDLIDINKQLESLLNRETTKLKLEEISSKSNIVEEETTKKQEETKVAETTKTETTKSQKQIENEEYERIKKELGAI